MSSMRVRFCCAASSFSSAARRRALYFVTPAASSMSMPAIGRARAQDQPDLALLDDRVGLGAEARVHQQVVDVPEAAGLTVDQVFALTRAIEPARDLDVARDRRFEVDVEPVVMAVAVCVAVAVAIPLPFALAWPLPLAPSAWCPLPPSVLPVVGLADAARR